MLFTTAEEIKRFLPQSREFDFDAIAPFIRKHEPVLLKKHLGSVLYKKLCDAYEANDLTEEMTELLDLARDPVANFAYLKYLPWSTTQRGKGGITRKEGSDVATPYEHQMVEMMNECTEGTFSGAEQLLLFLEENMDEDQFSDWSASPAYTFFKECFIQTAIQFSDYYDIGDSRRTFLSMRTLMIKIETTRLFAVIGKDLYAELKEQFQDVVPEMLTDENKALLPFIRRAVANLTIAQACIHLPVRITADGIQLLSMSDRMTQKVRTPAETERLSAIITDCESAGESALKELRDFIYDNIDDYDTFRNDDTVYVDPDSDAGDFDQSNNGMVLI